MADHAPISAIGQRHPERPTAPIPPIIIGITCRKPAGSRFYCRRGTAFQLDHGQAETPRLGAGAEPRALALETACEPRWRLPDTLFRVSDRSGQNTRPAAPIR